MPPVTPSAQATGVPLPAVTGGVSAAATGSLLWGWVGAMGWELCGVSVCYSAEELELQLVRNRRGAGQAAKPLSQEGTLMEWTWGPMMPLDTPTAPNHQLINKLRKGLIRPKEDETDDDIPEPCHDAAQARSPFLLPSPGGAAWTVSPN